MALLLIAAAVVDAIAPLLAIALVARPELRPGPDG